MHDVAWRGMWICVRSKDAQKQLARSSLKYSIVVATDSDIPKYLFCYLVKYI